MTNMSLLIMHMSRDWMISTCNNSLKGFDGTIDIWICVGMLHHLLLWKGSIRRVYLLSFNTILIYLSKNYCGKGELVLVYWIESEGDDMINVLKLSCALSWTLYILGVETCDINGLSLSSSLSLSPYDSCMISGHACVGIWSTLKHGNITINKQCSFIYLLTVESVLGQAIGEEWNFERINGVVAYPLERLFLGCIP